MGQSRVKYYECHTLTTSSELQIDEYNGEVPGGGYCQGTDVISEDF